MSTMDPRHFRDVMGRFATGVTVISWAVEARPFGMTANAFMAVSLSPPLVAVSVRQESRFNASMRIGDCFGISILTGEQEDVSAHFGGKPSDQATVVFEQHAGIPLIAGCLANMVCRVVNIHPEGDHLLYVGELEYISVGRDSPPLIFFSGKYEQILAGQPERVAA